jgi:hypothetical protein
MLRAADEGELVAMCGVCWVQGCRDTPCMSGTGFVLTAGGRLSLLVPEPERFFGRKKCTDT